MKLRIIPSLLALSLLMSCGTTEPNPGTAVDLEVTDHNEAPAFKYETERFADLRVLRYRVPGFEGMELKRKKLIYYLYEAALCGREIVYDQKYRYNLPIKRTVEHILNNYGGDRTTFGFTQLEVYAKRIWFSNGIHHHYSGTKFEPGFTQEDFAHWVCCTPGPWPTRRGQSLNDFVAELTPAIFDPEFDSKLVNKKRGTDLVLGSAANFYESDLTQKEVEDFYAAKVVKGEARPVSWGLQSRLERGKNGLIERVYKIDGLYGPAIKEIVFWLEKACTVAENEAQRLALTKLIHFYRTGSLRDWDDYNIAWVNDTDSEVDTINGFIEVYNDSMGMRGSWESVVAVRDPEASKRIAKIASWAQWFEDNSPLIESHKKKKVKGISARVINVIVEGGDASPSTPIGINLPNANWIRAEHGSKSVNLANIVSAYAQGGGGSLAEFAWDQAEIDRARAHGDLADKLHTDMHEVIGHASGQINPGIGTPKETLKNYASTLEEARADLVALYYMIDPKLVELGLMSTLDVGKESYESYVRNGMMLQLRRLKLGDDIEEDHMRNRQLIVKWAYEKGMSDKVIERRTRDGKTFFVVNDFEKLRVIFGQLLREIQRIKSEGDSEAGEKLVETYGVKVDQDIHKEVLARYAALDIPAYSGFINPELTPVMSGDEIIDVTISYPDDFRGQMERYAQRYGFLPAWN